jgi:HD-like signal output (HDOD) protein
MGKINVNSLKVGMILAEDVKDRNGRLLLSSGLALTDKHIRILKIWGVPEADIEGVSRENVEEEVLANIPEEFLEAAREYMAVRFRHNDPEHEAVAELMRYCTMRKAQEMLRQKLKPGDLVPPRPEQAGEGGLERLPDMDPYALIHEDLKLGSLPVIFHKLVEVVNDSRSSATDVAEIISNDTDLSARLLRVVNSAFYGLRSKVDTISRAVAVLGSNQLVSLAMGISVITFFKGIPDELIDMRSFWKHSISCGVGARLLASYHKTPNTERFFVGGLLHDIGRLIIYKLLSGEAKVMLDEARRSGRILTDVEKERLGFGHHKLGGILLQKWKFPVSLEKNVRFHHEAHKAPNRLEASIMLFADIMANALELGSSGERMVPVLREEAWETLDLPLSIISQTGMQMDYQVDEILHFFTNDG